MQTHTDPTEPIPTDDLVTLGQAARMVPRTYRSLLQMLDRGEFTRVDIAGRHFIRRSELRARFAGRYHEPPWLAPSGARRPIVSSAH
jgi:hypothetical protein